MKRAALRTAEGVHNDCLRHQATNGFTGKASVQPWCLCSQHPSTAVTQRPSHANAWLVEPRVHVTHGASSFLAKSLMEPHADVYGTHFVSSANMSSSREVHFRLIRPKFCESHLWSFLPGVCVSFCRCWHQHAADCDSWNMTNFEMACHIRFDIICA